MMVVEQGGTDNGLGMEEGCHGAVSNTVLAETMRPFSLTFYDMNAELAFREEMAGRRNAGVEAFLCSLLAISTGFCVIDALSLWSSWGALAMTMALRGSLCLLILCFLLAVKWPLLNLRGGQWLTCLCYLSVGFPAALLPAYVSHMGSCCMEIVVLGLMMRLGHLRFGPAVATAAAMHMALWSICKWLDSQSWHPPWSTAAEPKLKFGGSQGLSLQVLLALWGLLLCAYLTEVFLRRQFMTRWRLQQKTQEVQKEVGSASDADVLKSQFVANMSHEIRHPIVSILGGWEMLDSTSLVTHQREFAQTIQSSAQSLLTMVNDVLDFSKISAGCFKLQFKSFKVLDLVEETAELVAPAGFEKGLHMVTVVEQQLCTTAVGDPAVLQQILKHLLANGCKFTKQGEVGMVVSLVEETDGMMMASFSCIDTGIGVPAEKVNNLFREFNQIDRRLAREYEGMGLGLALVKGYVNLLGGKVGVSTNADTSSKAPTGSVFWVEIPLHRVMTNGLDRTASGSLVRSLSARISNHNAKIPKFLSMHRPHVHTNEPIRTSKGDKDPERLHRKSSIGLGESVVSTPRTSEVTRILQRLSDGGCFPASQTLADVEPAANPWLGLSSNVAFVCPTKGRLMNLMLKTYLAEVVKDSEPKVFVGSSARSILARETYRGTQWEATVFIVYDPLHRLKKVPTASNMGAIKWVLLASNDKVFKQAESMGFDGIVPPPVRKGVLISTLSRVVSQCFDAIVSSAADTQTPGTPELCGASLASPRIIDKLCKRLTTIRDARKVRGKEGYYSDDSTITKTPPTPSRFQSLNLWQQNQTPPLPSPSLTSRRSTLSMTPRSPSFPSVLSPPSPLIALRPQLQRSLGSAPDLTLLASRQMPPSLARATASANGTSRHSSPSDVFPEIRFRPSHLPDVVNLSSLPSPKNPALLNTPSSGCLRRVQSQHSLSDPATPSDRSPPSLPRSRLYRRSGSAPDLTLLAASESFWQPSLRRLSYRSLPTDPLDSSPQHRYRPSNIPAVVGLSGLSPSASLSPSAGLLPSSGLQASLLRRATPNNTEQQNCPPSPPIPLVLNLNPIMDHSPSPQRSPRHSPARASPRRSAFPPSLPPETPGLAVFDPKLPWTAPAFQKTPPLPSPQAPPIAVPAMLSLVPAILPSLTGLQSLAPDLTVPNLPLRSVPLNQQQPPVPPVMNFNGVMPSQVNLQLPAAPPPGVRHDQLQLVPPPALRGVTLGSDGPDARAMGLSGFPPPSVLNLSTPGSPTAAPGGVKFGQRVAGLQALGRTASRRRCTDLPPPPAAVPGLGTTTELPAADASLVSSLPGVPQFVVLLLDPVATSVPMNIKALETPGLSVVGVKGPEDALQKWRATKFDVVFISVGDAEGERQRCLSMAETIRSEEKAAKRPVTPLVAVSGNPPSLQTCNVFNDVMQHPLLRDGVLAMVRKWAGKLQLNLLCEIPLRLARDRSSDGGGSRKTLLARRKTGMMEKEITRVMGSSPLPMDAAEVELAHRLQVYTERRRTGFSPTSVASQQKDSRQAKGAPVPLESSQNATSRYRKVGEYAQAGPKEGQGAMAGQDLMSLLLMSAGPEHFTNSLSKLSILHETEPSRRSTSSSSSLGVSRRTTLDGMLRDVPSETTAPYLVSASTKPPPASLVVQRRTSSATRRAIGRLTFMGPIGEHSPISASRSGSMPASGSSTPPRQLSPNAEAGLSMRNLEQIQSGRSLSPSRGPSAVPSAGWTHILGGKHCATAPNQEASVQKMSTTTQDSVSRTPPWLLGGSQWAPHAAALPVFLSLACAPSTVHSTFATIGLPTCCMCMLVLAYSAACLVGSWFTHERRKHLLEMESPPIVGAVLALGCQVALTAAHSEGDLGASLWLTWFTTVNFMSIACRVGVFCVGLTLQSLLYLTAVLYLWLANDFKAGVQVAILVYATVAALLMWILSSYLQTRLCLDEDNKTRAVLASASAVPITMPVREDSGDQSATTEFLSILNHEVRTPLAAILGMTDLLLDSEPKLSLMQREILTTIQQCSQQLSSNIDEILDLAKAEEDKMVLRSEEMNIRTQVEDAIYSLYHMASSKGADIFVDTQMSSEWFLGDAFRFRQIVTSLLSSAIKHTRGGTVTVRVTVNEADGNDLAMLRVICTDSGGSIDEKQLQTIFSGLQEVEGLTVSPRKRGAAIELVAAQSVSRLMGGDCGVTRATSEGCNYWCKLQLKKVRQATKNEAKASRPSHVLILKPILSSALIVKRYLEGWGHSCIVRTTIAEAIAALAKQALRPSLPRQGAQPERLLVGDSPVELLATEGGVQPRPQSCDCGCTPFPTLHAAIIESKFVEDESEEASELISLLVSQRVRVVLLTRPRRHCTSTTWERLNAFLCRKPIKYWTLFEQLEQATSAISPEDAFSHMADKNIPKLTLAKSGKFALDVVADVAAHSSAFAPTEATPEGPAVIDPTVLSPSGNEDQRCEAVQGVAEAAASQTEKQPLPTAEVPVSPLRTTSGGPLLLLDVVQELNVLLVEDHVVNQKIARNLLEKDKHICQIAENGQIAVNAMESPNFFSLILMDCQMPVMDGFTATTRIREIEAREGRSRIPIIALTALNSPGDRDRCIAAGMDDYMTKPIKRDQLQKTIQRWISEKQETDAAAAVAAQNDTEVSATLMTTAASVKSNDSVSGNPVNSNEPLGSVTTNAALPTVAENVGHPVQQPGPTVESAGACGIVAIA